MLVDAEWRLHLRFYASIGAFLAPGGRVIFQENAGGSRPEDFVRMIADVRISYMDTWETSYFANRSMKPFFGVAFRYF